MAGMASPGVVSRAVDGSVVVWLARLGGASLVAAVRGVALRVNVWHGRRVMVRLGAVLCGSVMYGLVWLARLGRVLQGVVWHGLVLLAW